MGASVNKLKKEIAGLKKSLRNYEIDDKVKQPSINDEITRQLVESNVKVINRRYEISVSLKMDVVTNFPDNYVCALKLTTNLRRNALENVKLKDILEEIFQEMISEGWIVPVDDAILSDTKCWYLPFFVTKQDKARVVFDEAATFKGAVEDDLSKCFFQVAMRESQRDLFRLIWYRNNDLDKRKVQLYRFARHVWGINSSPLILRFLQLKS